MGVDNSVLNIDWQSRDDYFLEIADSVSKRATCDHGKSGCVIVRKIQITGFVGSPANFDHCDDIGHQIRRLTHEYGKVPEHCIRTIHAEQNAICQAAKQGISMEDFTIYTKMIPFRTCAMLIINCGIKRVVCERRYHDGKESEVMFNKAGIYKEFKYNELQKY